MGILTQLLILNNRFFLAQDTKGLPIATSNLLSRV